MSLGAVLPFLAVLTDPQRLWQQPLFQRLANQVGIANASQLLLPVTFAFAAAAVLAAVIRLENFWLNGRLAAAIGSDLSCEAYRRTLYQPYWVHVQRNSAAVITGTTTQIGRTVQAITSLLQLITAAVVAVFLLLGLLLINWAIALAAGALFGSVYALVALTSRKELGRNGQRIADAARQQIKALQEGLGAIRDVLLDGNQHAYVEIYRLADLPQRQLQAKNEFIGAFPRYSVEALGLVAIALLGGVLVQKQGETSSVIPLLGALAMGAQRLLPALQQVYGGWSNLNGYKADLAGVLDLLSQPLPPTTSVAAPLPLRKSIRFDSVYFSYVDEQPHVLEGLNLEIFRGERIGLIGTTGSGKSTMIDLLMGLLAPKHGHIFVDGQDLHDPDNPQILIEWRSAIAHVPQNIYLADTSFAENIAFGIPPAKIDLDRVKLVSEQAQIANFIEANSAGYLNYVGERGIRLSGGQRQRIGIARALYKKAQVLVLDEATSALDNITEEAVMAAVESLGKDLTIVMIAHRLSTIQRCDRVLKLESGKLIENYSF